MVNILGSPNSDTLTGSSGDDTLSGAGGDDLLTGLAGNDLLDGGDGNDSLYGGDGNDRLLGGLGADLLNGEAGNDTVDGGAGDDTLNGGTGNNSLSGGSGVDLLTGGANADTIDGGDGDDIILDTQGGGQIAGGAGNDTFRLTGSGSGTTLVDGGDGNADTVESVDVRNYRFSNVERLSLSVSVSSPGSTAQVQVTSDQVAGFSTIIGAGGGFARFAGGGDFSRVALVGVVGIDSILGSFVTGSDRLDLLSVAYKGTIHGGGGDDQISTSVNLVYGGSDSYGNGSLAGLETVFGDDGNDTITIRAAYYYTHYSVPDFARAPVLIDGGAGVDRLVIGSNATLAVTLTGTAMSGIEILQPVFRVMLTPAQFAPLTTLDLRPFDGSISYFYPINGMSYQPVPVGTLPYFEGAGSGLYDFASKIFLNSSIIGFFGGAGSETVIGVSGNDVLAGNDGDDALYGNAGNDSLTGGSGADALFGGSGRDTLSGGDGDDYLNGGADQNRITGGFGLDTLYLDGGRRVASISTSVESTIIDGNGRHPSLTGTADTPVQSNSFTGIERFAFADGMQVFETGDAAFLTARLFMAAFNRVPDPVGLTEVAQALRQGMTTVQLADALARSGEYQIRYPDQDSAGFVAQLYQNALGRAPEGFVSTYFTQALDTGTLSRGAIMDYIVRSDEALNRAQSMLSNGLWVPDFEGLEVARLAQATLGHHPSEAALSAWSRGVEAGGPLSDLATLFLASQEYQAAHGVQDDAAFVATIYNNALGRAPDAGGLAAWTGALAMGVTRGQVAADISQSAESHVFNAPWTADGIVFAG